MKTKIELVLLILATLALAACGKQASSGGACGSNGDAISVGSNNYCVYRGAVVVENGFECPSDLPNLSQQGGIGICSDQQSVPAGDVDQIDHRYRQKHPDFQDCIVDDECDAGQVCNMGTCETHNANNTTNNGTNNGTTGTNNGTTGTNNTTTTCRNDADCAAGQVCLDGLCAAACTADSDCMTGQVCQLGRCMSPAPMCTSDADCRTNQTCDNGQCLQICGGLAPMPTSCATDEWCDYADAAMCGAADQPGVCRKRPDACTADVTPVCGCDSMTYDNACKAHLAGVDDEMAGACP